MMEEDADFIFALTYFTLVHSILGSSYLKLVNLQDNLHQLFNQLTVPVHTTNLIVHIS